MEKRKEKVNQGLNMMVFWSTAMAKEKKRRRNGNKGFSLVELVIVIAIMAILAAAIAPAIIRYIEKARKAVDIETAQTIFEAANLASVSPDDDVVNGWYVSADTTGNDVGRSDVTDNGHNAKLDKTSPKAYTVSVVAWARGIDYNGWQNAQFKGVLDHDTGGMKNSMYLQQCYTNEFLKNLEHLGGISTTYKGAGKNSYDGKSVNTMEFKYKGDAGYGKPECWILVIRSDNYKPEIWIGDKRVNSNSTGAVRPIYRLYPEPCPEYKK
ncbi:MAG: prepilin-type N-terminal cleavage/methylation domain-containing protein [Eubacterium sp.]|nr:prepilin-type N-terminal cleavage/methylation domain-containing protein [Eubacterium sp.]